MKSRFGFSSYGISRYLTAAGLVAVIGACGVGQLRAETVLKFATAQAPNNAVTKQCFEPIVDNINKAAGSEFKVQLVHAPMLANLTNVWDRVANGVADIGFGIHGTTNLPFPKSTVGGLPFAVDR